MIQILIADDHEVFRDGIASIIEDIADIEVIAQAENGRVVLDILQSKQPDVILMDISMGDAGGIDTTILLKKKFPKIQVLVLSMHEETDYIIKMIDAGASGYLLKDAGSEEVIQAIRAVANGSTYYSQQVSAALIQHMTASKNKPIKKIDAPLTKREIEILKLIVEENTNAEIAALLYISIRTVDTHKRNLIEKLGVKNTVGLVKYAFKKGIVA